VDIKKRGKIRERALRVLLNNPDGTLTKYRVAKHTESSFSWVHEYLKQLEEKHLVEETRVVDYRRLVDEWVSIRLPPKRTDYSIQEPMKYLNESKLKYAATTYRAESQTQGYLFPSRTDIYIKPAEEEAWTSSLKADGLRGKGNLRLLIDDEHVFYGAKTVNNLCVVSTPQLIVDLLAEGGVCAEAAEMLLMKAVKPSVPVT
jgi:hypothetical protein